MARFIHPIVPLGDGETLTSYVSRLALLHKAGSARMFASDIGFRFQDFVDGDAGALHRFAELTGADEFDLARNAITVDDAYWRLGGQLMTKFAMQRTSMSLCRACIADDIAGQARPDLAAYGRAAWQIVSIRTCPIHCQPIVIAVEAPHASLCHDFAALVGPRTAEIAALAASEPHRHPTDFERYLLARLAGATDQSTPWLDSLEFAAAAKACEIVGAVRLRGHKARMRTMTDANWHAAGGAGYAILRGGEPALRAFLEELDATYPYGPHGNERAQAVFGDLFKWLSFQAREAIFEPVRDIVRRYIVETFPVAAEETILGKTIEKRMVHSIYTASRESGVHPKRLRKLLAAAGLVAPEMMDAHDNRVRFSADAAAIVIAEEQDAIALPAVLDYINADRVHGQLLADNGFIKPTSTFAKGNKARYAKAELDDFLHRLGHGAQIVQTAPAGAYTIPAAAKRANCSAVEILNLILGKKLGWTGRLTAERGYLAILVDLDEIKRHVHGAALDGLTARQVEKRLKTATKVVVALIDHGHLTQTTVINPVNRCPIKIIAREQVEEFERTYASLSTLADERGLHFRALKAKLTALGVYPALESETYHATFYRRADIPAFLVPAKKEPVA